MNARTAPELEDDAPASDPEALREELAEAEAKVATVARENEALGGEPHDHVRVASVDVTPNDLGAYRTPDPAVRLREALDDAQAKVVDLEMEQIFLRQAREKVRAAKRAKLVRVGLAIAAMAFAAAGFWLALSGTTREFGLVVWAAVILALGAFIWVLVRRIPPNHDAPKGSRYVTR